MFTIIIFHHFHYHTVIDIPTTHPFYLELSSELEIGMNEIAPRFREGSKTDVQSLGV